MLGDNIKNNKLCVSSGCEQARLASKQYCALHCEKNKYSDDYRSDLLVAFKKALIKEIINSLKISNSLDSLISIEDVSFYLEAEEYTHKEYNELLNKEILVLNDVHFPEYKHRDPFDYTKVLRLFNKIHFNRCHFYVGLLGFEGSDPKDKEFFFQDCVFHKWWVLKNFSILENADGVLYQQCIFKGDVENSHNESGGLFMLESNQFDFTCIFSKSLKLSSLSLKGKLFSSEQMNYPAKEQIPKIAEISLNKTSFQQRFTLNNISIGLFKAQDCIFKNKFEFKNNHVDDFELNNANFEGLFDCFETHFIHFNVFKCIFESFTGFESCLFGKSGREDEVAEFTYATFMSFINFRNARFNSGLNLDNTNLKEPPNFLNVSVEPKYTNRETLRIIKYSFQRLGNTIEGNKFYSEELAKYHEELKQLSWRKNFEEKAVFYTNGFISEFGRSFLRPIGLFVLVAIFHYFLLLGYEADLLYRLYPPINPYMSWFFGSINKIANNVFPFQTFVREGMELISILISVMYSVLIWQTIAAVKLHTRKK